MDESGDLTEIQGEITIEWKIKNIFPLSDKEDKYYESPKFYFSGASWRILLYPNGQISDTEDTSVGLHFRKTSVESPLTVKVSVSLQTAEGKTYVERAAKGTVLEKNRTYGWTELVSRSELLEKKSQLTASDDLIVIFNIKNSNPNTLSGSLFCRLQEISDDLEKTYLKATKSNFQLKLQNRNILAHRMILQTRSSVFAAMLSHDTKENQKGEVSIEDVEYSAMNDLPLYAAAEKYDIQAVKEMCSNFILRNLSVDCVLDVIRFAELHQDKSLNLRCRDFFKENADKILETAHWESFVKENHSISVELLAIVVKSLFKK